MAFRKNNLACSDQHYFLNCSRHLFTIQSLHRGAIEENPVQYGYADMVEVYFFLMRFFLRFKLFPTAFFLIFNAYLHSTHAYLELCVACNTDSLWC